MLFRSTGFDCNYSTRTRDGKFVIRSDNAAGATVDTFRNQLAVLGVPNGFLRQSAQYTVDPTGLGLAYRIVDKEVFLLPPSPAFKADGDYSESGTLQGGFIRYGEVNLTLAGSNQTSRGDLMVTALRIAAAKLYLGSGGGQPGGGNIIPFEVAAKVKMYDNVVSVHMRAMLNSSKGRIATIASLDSRAVASIDGTFGKSPPPYTDRGTAGLHLQAAAY